MDAQNAASETGDADGKMMVEAGFRSLVVPLQADHVAGIRPTLLLVQAGAVCLLADRRRQPRQPASHPRERAMKELAVRQRDRREPTARDRPGDGGDDLLAFVGGLLGLLRGRGRRSAS